MPVNDEFRGMVLGISAVEWAVSDIAHLAYSLGFRLYDCYAAEGGETHIRISLGHPNGLTWHVHKNNDEFFFQRIILEINESISGEDEATYHARRLSFDERYLVVVRDVQQLIGPAIYSGAYGDNCFPTDYYAMHVTRWQIANGYLLVSQEQHVRRDDPLVLAIVATPFRDNR